MALSPTDPDHALQILAGTEGRRRGHEFEFELAKSINNLETIQPLKYSNNIITGNPASALVHKALRHFKIDSYSKINAIALGGLATSEGGKKWLEINGIPVTACKSDILLNIYSAKNLKTVGISVKQCSNKTPTNAQLYFTTAKGFIKLLNNNGILCSNNALVALKQFCGDEGFRPLDDKIKNRLIDPRRYFWEEINPTGKIELETIFQNHQKKITRLLLQKAYINDPFIPELLIHKTKKIENGPQEFALYSIDELVDLSKNMCGFKKKLYSVRKGQYKDPPGVSHEAPRFGIVQMQRGGQKQHPTQLQFNLQAGYFYKI